MPEDPVQRETTSPYLSPLILKELMLLCKSWICKSFLQNSPSLQELGSTGLIGTGWIWMAACILMLQAANMENMPAVHMEEQQCPLAKCWFPHMQM